MAVKQLHGPPLDDFLRNDLSERVVPVGQVKRHQSAFIRLGHANHGFRLENSLLKDAINRHRAPFKRSQCR
jgi:hypothetical protein